jgi:hypothetical protein
LAISNVALCWRFSASARSNSGRGHFLVPVSTSVYSPTISKPKQPKLKGRLLLFDCTWFPNLQAPEDTRWRHYHDVTTAVNMMNITFLPGLIPLEYSPLAYCVHPIRLPPNFPLETGSPMSDSLPISNSLSTAPGAKPSPVVCSNQVAKLPTSCR